jgi:hypothetical protein
MDFKQSEQEIENSDDFAGWAEPPRMDGQPRFFNVKNYQEYVARLLRQGAKRVSNSPVNIKQ